MSIVSFVTLAKKKFADTKIFCILILLDTSVIVFICGVFIFDPMMGEVGFIFLFVGGVSGGVVGQYWKNYFYSDVNTCCVKDFAFKELVENEEDDNIANETKEQILEMEKREKQKNKELREESLQYSVEPQEVLKASDQHDSLIY